MFIRLPYPIVLLFLSIASTSFAQLTTQIEPLPRLAGMEPTSHIEYLRIFLNGTLLRPAGPAPQPPPQIVAQCTRNPSGKLAFELFVNFGGIEDTAFYPPWRPASDTDLFPPHLETFKFTFEFIGYTHVKPVKREFQAVLQPSGQFRYNTPSAGSANLEDITYYLRYLLALPTLRLTLGNHTAEFLTTPLLDQLRKEPLCKASLL